MNNVWNEKCNFSVSLITLDFLKLGEQVRNLEENGIKMLHIDVVDGHFSPEMQLGYAAIDQLRKYTDIFFDCHVMADPPEWFVDKLLDIGVQHICFHIESSSHIDGLINRIHNAQVLAGIALKPATSLVGIEYIIEKCNSVMLMFINPGYATNKKEEQIPYIERKLYDLRTMIARRNLKTKIIIDGRISKENIKKYGKELADIFVCGSTCIDRENIPKTVDELYTIRKELLMI